MSAMYLGHQPGGQALNPERRSWRRPILVFILGTACVLLSSGALSAAKSFGFSGIASPWSFGVVVGATALVTSLLLPGAPMAFSVGAAAVFLIYGVFCGSAACMAVNFVMGFAVFVPSIVGEAAAAVCRATRRRWSMRR